MSELFFIKRTGNDAPNLLIFTEAAGATYMLAFHYACELLHQQKRLNFAAIEERQIPAEPAAASNYISRVFNSFPPALVIFSRFAHPSAPEIIKRHRPCVCHLDDNFFSLPPWFKEIEPLHRYAARGLEYRRFLAENADCILTSTKELAGQVKSLFPAKQVTSLLYPPYLGPDHFEDTSKEVVQSPVIGYFGSLSHQRDLELTVPALCEILENDPRVRFETLGPVSLPERLRRFDKQTVSYPAVRGYEQFVKRLPKLKWNVGLAPLERNEFTAAKSVIKVLQYTALGIPAVASKVPPYSGSFDEQSLILAGPGDWKENIESLLYDPRKRSSLVNAAAAYCSRHYALGQTARELCEFLNSLSPGFTPEGV